MQITPNLIVATIANGDTEKAIKLCQLLLQGDHDAITQLALITGQYHRQLGRYDDGLVTDKKHSVEVNKVNYKILQLLGSIYQANFFPKEIVAIPYFDLSSGFVGRQDELSKLNAWINSDEPSNILLINGVGGVGKSSLVQYYLQSNRNQFDHFIHLELLSNFIETIVSNEYLLSSLGLQFEEGTDDNYILQKVFHVLNSIDGNNLIVIENCTQEIRRYSALLSGLASWKIILTSRVLIDGLTTIEVDRLAEDAASALFYTNSKVAVDDQALQKVLRFINWHPLTIILLAKTTRYKKLSIKELIIDLEIDGLDLKDSVEVGLNGMNPITIQQHIYSRFLIVLSKSCKFVLSQYSILPSASINPKELKKWLKYDKGDFYTIQKELLDKGWLIETTTGYYCHKLLREAVLLQLKTSVQDSSVLITSLSVMLESELHGIDKRGYLIYAEEVSRKVKGDSVELSVLRNNIGTSLLGLGKYQNGALYIEESLNVLEKDSENYLPALENRFTNLGELYRNLGDYDRSQYYFEKSLTLLQEHSDKFGKEDIARVYLGVTNLLMAQGEVNGAQKFCEIAAANLENIDLMHPKLAYVYNTLGSICLRLGHVDNGIAVQKKAVDFSREFLGEDHPIYAVALGNLADLYSHPAKGRFVESLKMREAAIRKLAAIVGKQHPDVGKLIGNQGTCLMNMREYESAQGVFSLAVEVLSKTFPEDHPEVLKMKKYAAQCAQLKRR